MTQGTVRLAGSLLLLVGTNLLTVGETGRRDAHEEELVVAHERVQRAERRYGDQSLEVAEQLSTLGHVLQAHAQENLVLGTAIARRALAIAEAHSNDEALARALEDLAMWLWYGREFEEERRLAQRALAIREQAQPPDAGRLAGDLHLLADICFVAGDYGCALQLWERAGPLWERAYGRDSDAMATHAYRLAQLQFTLRNREAALELAARAVSIREELLPTRDPRLARSLNLLGRLSVETGELERAEVLLQRARIIWEVSGGGHDTDMADVLRSQALLASKRGDLEAAVALYRRVADIRSTALGPDHPLVGQTLAELGAVERRHGERVAARASLRRALELLEKNELRAYPNWAETLREQALLDGEEGRLDEALAEALEAEQISREHFRMSALGLSEREALARARERASTLSLAWDWASALERGGALDDAVASWLLDEGIRSRALVLDTLAFRQRTLAIHPDGDTAARVNRLRRAREHLTRLLVAGDTARVAEARAEADRAERALAEKSREYRDALARGDPGRAEVQRALSPGTALVSYFHQEEPSRAYVASVLLPGAAAPRIVPLGGAAEIDAAVQSWNARVSSDPRLHGAAAGEAAYRAAARRLAERIWDPVAPYLARADRVLVVSEGALHAVSLATLVSARGNYLVDSGLSFHYLTAERDVVGVEEDSPSASGLLALGDPAHQAGFTPLPGSRREVLDVAARWSHAGPTKVLLGGDAQESFFKKLAPSFGVLHIAAHNFFRTAETQDESPLRIAGLVLAGGSDKSDADDGILTAEEVALLDLRAVRWAVLSGCATGRGALEPGEGVLGLRRAFQLAGARTLIVSLWPVEDDATRHWMRALYDARRAGASTVDAVQAAMRGALEEQRRSGGTTHPYFWGGFVSIGDWR